MATDVERLDVGPLLQLSMIDAPLGEGAKPMEPDTDLIEEARGSILHVTVPTVS
ncbi:MAG: hypothetical protein HYZ58_10995 [Acidobacteria bacterium]|nr:hypothetical protein [Acidobacteriota bacterium]